MGIMPGVIINDEPSSRGAWTLVIFLFAKSKLSRPINLLASFLRGKGKVTRHVEDSAAAFVLGRKCHEVKDFIYNSPPQLNSNYILFNVFSALRQCFLLLNISLNILRSPAFRYQFKMQPKNSKYSASESTQTHTTSRREEKYYSNSISRFRFMADYLCN